ncbi:MAG: hypothetical protein KAS72_01395 [Phycisphaerales bacterium]|nr:hypothetical protein [Phycisphaerales bacterium]
MIADESQRVVEPDDTPTQGPQCVVLLPRAGAMPDDLRCSLERRGVALVELDDSHLAMAALCVSARRTSTKSQGARTILLIVEPDEQPNVMRLLAAVRLHLSGTVCSAYRRDGSPQLSAIDGRMGDEADRRHHEISPSGGSRLRPPVEVDAVTGPPSDPSPEQPRRTAPVRSAYGLHGPAAPGSRLRLADVADDDRARLLESDADEDMAGASRSTQLTSEEIAMLLADDDAIEHTVEG